MRRSAAHSRKMRHQREACPPSSAITTPIDVASPCHDVRYLSRPHTLYTLTAVHVAPVTVAVAAQRGMRPLQVMLQRLSTAERPYTNGRRVPSSTITTPIDVASPYQLPLTA